MSPFAAGQQGARLQKAKSDYGKMMANRQPGGYSSIPSQGKKDAFVQAQRQKFFDNRPDVSEDRIFRRTRQEGGIDQFKQALIDKGRVLTGTRADGSTYTVMNPNTGEPVFLTDRPGGRSVSDVAQDLAFRFGPTPSEIASDMGYAIGSMGKGLGQFISKGGVIGNVLSGLYDKFKGGTQQGIETVKDLYDNLRTTLSDQPTVVTGGGSTIVTTSDGQPRIDLTPTSITTETLPAMNLSRNVGDESDPSIFGIENPLFNQQVYEPFRVSDMDITGLTAQNLIDPTRVGQTVSDYYDAALQGVDINTPIGKLNLNPMAQKVFLDGRMGNLNYGGSFDPDTSDYNVGIGTQLPYGVGLSLGASSNDIPGMSFNKYIGPVNTSLNLSEQGGSVGLNTIVDPLRAIYPSSAIGVPINVGASVDSTGRITPNIGLAVPFKDGGSVDKYAGLGYKLK